MTLLLVSTNYDPQLLLGKTGILAGDRLSVRTGMDFGICCKMEAHSVKAEVPNQQRTERALP